METTYAGNAGNGYLSLGPKSKPVRWDGLVNACMDLTPALTDLISQFWGVPVQLGFFGASSQMHYFWRMDDFHVSQLQLEKASDTSRMQATADLRLSESLCATLLSRVLGPRASSVPGFSFKQLSPLEATILNEFSRDLLATFKKGLLKKPTRKAADKQIHLVWMVALAEPQKDLHRVMDPLASVQFLEGLELGKVVLSLPLNAIRQVDEQTAIELLPDDVFFSAVAMARIDVGTSQVPLADLDMLEAGDMIVLENSSASRMALVEPESGERIPFEVEIANRQSITIPYAQEFDEMDTQLSGGSARQKLWDNLMIDVGAEFEPVKLPLKQLKQMSEGLVVELGDLVHNRISLRVEGKTLAYGELVIVGDKFGVRVSQVLVDGAPSSQEAALPAQSSAHTQQPAPQQEALQAAPQQSEAAPVEEEINLDNFLNEDFDETFEDGEEEW